ncbi:MAG: LysR family transcriptional regulator [Acidaminococcaceae bacterium]|nr:LysR family transcriptional regulator [Acidaminococcaceae bacterium]MDD4721561.1 LysR family transcriptional regulator [Acidaminococcaceae bacterium]
MFFLGIETFLVVIKEGNITSASSKLHIAQSTASQRIQSLENEVGMKLLERGKGFKHITLTPSGEEFLKLAYEWEKIWKKSLILREQGPKLYLSIGATDSINTFLLPCLFESLNKHFPAVGLTLNSMHSWELYMALEKGYIDVGIGLQELFYPNIISTKFYSAPMVVIRPACTSGQKNRIISPNELNPDQEVLVNWGHEFKVWHDKWWNPLSPSRFKVDYIHLAFALLKNPEQWLILPLNIAKIVMQQDNYFLYELSDSPPPYCCYKITRKKKTKLTTKAINLFDEYLQLCLADNDFFLGIKATDHSNLKD